MTAAQLIYPLMFIVVIYFIFSNIKNSAKYKKENMEVLLLLNEDDKRVHLMSRLLMAVLILVSAVLIRGLIEAKTYATEEVLIMGVLPVLMIGLYIPLSKKTMVSTLGIHKRSNLVRWEEIKGLEYKKPDAKGKVKVNVLYSLMNRDTNINLTFLKDDPQLDKFKELAKTYRNTKKKGKKSGK